MSPAKPKKIDPLSNKKGIFGNRWQTCSLPSKVLLLRGVATGARASTGSGEGHAQAESARRDLDNSHLVTETQVKHPRQAVVFSRRSSRSRWRHHLLGGGFGGRGGRGSRRRAGRSGDRRSYRQYRCWCRCGLPRRRRRLGRRSRPRRHRASSWRRRAGRRG